MFLKRFLSSAASDALKKRQQELMSRSLPKKKTLSGVDNVILVASGKGGVGKSTTAVNLACALQMKSLKVGLLDADVYGPSIPIMMNLQEQPLVDDKTNKMIPLENYGIKCMSMGFLVDPSEAIVWRGPMVMGAINKMIFGSIWDFNSTLDVIIVDLPPGTGDIHLSIAQNLHVNGAIVVTTPQKVALADAKKAVKMFERTQIPVIGLIENMSSFECPNCSKVTHVFGEKHNLLEDIPTLGKIPLDVDIMRNADEGTPLVITHPNSIASQVYQSISDQIVVNSLCSN